MKVKFAFSLILILASAAASAVGPIIISAPYSPTTATSVQPTSCSGELNGKVYPCTLVKDLATNAVTPNWDFTSLPIPGVYQNIVLKVDASENCYGGPAAIICDYPAYATATINLTLNAVLGVAPSGIKVKPGAAIKGLQIQ